MGWSESPFGHLVTPFLKQKWKESGDVVKERALTQQASVTSSILSTMTFSESAFLHVTRGSSDLGGTICLPWSLEDSERKMCYTWSVIMKSPGLSVKQHGGKMV